MFHQMLEAHLLLLPSHQLLALFQIQINMKWLSWHEKGYDENLSSYDMLVI